MILISNLLSFILLTYLSNSFLSFKYSKNKYILSVLAATTLVSICNYNGGSPTKATIILFIYFAYVFILFDGKTLNKALVIIPFFIFQIISELLVGFILGQLSFIDLSNDINSIGYIYGIILSISLSAFFTFTYVYILKNLQINYFPKYTWFIFIIPILTIILLINVDDYFVIFDNHHIFICVLSLSILNLIFYLVFTLVINTTNIKLKLQKEKQQKELYESKMNLLAQHYEYNYKFLHNLLHTCNELHISLNNSNYNETIQIVEQLAQTTHKEFNAIYSNSLILNYVINEKLDEIVTNKINIKTNIQNNTFNSIDYSTQINLYDYLITIAIDSCLESNNEEKVIIFEAGNKTNYTFIKLILPVTSINNKINNDLSKILENYSYNYKITNNLFNELIILINDRE